MITKEWTQIIAEAGATGIIAALCLYIFYKLIMRVMDDHKKERDEWRVEIRLGRKNFETSLQEIIRHLNQK